MLVSSVYDNKTQMYYNKSFDDDDYDDDYDENEKVMGIKLNFSFTGEGQVFILFVTVSGLTKI